MKVLLLSPLPPPVGGIASWSINVLSYYENNPRDGFHLIHQNTAMKYRSITRKTFIYRLVTGVIDSAIVVFCFLWNLIRYRPDVIHLTSSGSLGLFKDILIAFLSRVFNVPLVIHYRFGRIPEVKKKNNIEWKMILISVFLSSGIIVLDDYSFSVLRNRTRRRVYKIPNAISMDIIDFINNNLSSFESSSKASIIFVGHVVTNKGIFDLLDACSNMSLIDELVIVGPYEEDVKDKILLQARKSKFKIKLTGPLDKNSVLSLMRKASLLVLPSYTEGFPNVIIEAMAMRCPVIATNVGAIPDILDVNTSKPLGLVVSPGDVYNLSLSISNLLSNRELVETFKERAFKKVMRDYTLKVVCRNYEMVWNEVRKK